MALWIHHLFDFSESKKVGVAVAGERNESCFSQDLEALDRESLRLKLLAKALIGNFNTTGAVF
jgi:hypothetical protein